jgi:hypothetical protein
LIKNIVNRTQCETSDGDWINEDENFDNIFNSILTLFQMMNTEGWEGVMRNAVDSVEIDM